jgi:hypothetical protein
MAWIGRERNDLLRVKRASHIAAVRLGVPAATRAHVRPCVLKLSKNRWHSSSAHLGPSFELLALTLVFFCSGRATA